MLRYQDLIVEDRDVCGGQPSIKGTRITVRTVLSSLAQGSSMQDLLTEFSTLTEEGVKAALAFAAQRVFADMPNPPDAA